jgi:hypothetical protein
MTRVKQISKLGVKYNSKANYAWKSRVRCVKGNPLETEGKSVKGGELALKMSVPVGARTRNLLLRRQLLYPIELQGPSPSPNIIGGNAVKGKRNEHLC